MIAFLATMVLLILCSVLVMVIQNLSEDGEVSIASINPSENYIPLDTEEIEAVDIDATTEIIE